MPRIIRIDIKDHIYHVLNRSNARVQIFDNDDDYRLFETILEEAIERFNVEILAYCIMPNHWHLILKPKSDGELQKFMGWLTNTHTRRWHTIKHTIGQGHLYQGRYKSFICQEDNYFLTLIRYVERNAKKANLVEKAEDWRWGSAWRLKYGSVHQKQLLSSWPIEKPQNYYDLLNESQSEEVQENFKKSLERGSPFGDYDWITKIVEKFNIKSTLRPTGRPKKGG